MYYLEFFLYFQDEANRYYSFPLKTLEISKDTPKLTKAGKSQLNMHKLIEHKMKQNSFSSRAFMVRYSKEEVQINEQVTFRSEIDVSRDYLSTEYRLGVNLFWGDVDHLRSQELKA